jgi:hypothetical protein
MTKAEILHELQKMQCVLEVLKGLFLEKSLGWLALEVAWQAVRVARFVVDQDNDDGKLMFLQQALAEYRMKQKESDRAQSIGKKARKA